MTQRKPKIGDRHTVMTFSRHKGKHVSELPDSFLRSAEEGKFPVRSAKIAAAMEAEILFRFGRKVTVEVAPYDGWFDKQRG